MLSLRSLTPDDWKLWRQLRLAALEEAPDAFGATLAEWLGEGDREVRWRARLSIPGGQDFVAFLRDEPVGMASGVPVEDDDHSRELISMWVSPGARGTGVGDYLIRGVEDWARATGATRLKLSVWPDNENAVSLYQRNGLAATGESGADERADGRREQILAKQLVSPTAHPSKDS